MRFVFCDSEEFAQRTRAFLESRLECNLMANVLRNIREGFYRQSEARFAYGLDPGDVVSFAALRTPPWEMLASPLDPVHGPQLVAEWLEHDPDLSGINALTPTARAIAAAWQAQTGGRTRCHMRQGMYSLTEAHDPARPAPGRLRLPEEGEHDLVMRWAGQFGREVGLHGPETQATVRTRLAVGALMLWDDGRPVSMVGMTPPLAGVVRIGPVYTPSADRRRGYATVAVAAVSRLALARGAEACMLYTDMDNPTSNKIYIEIGYRHRGDVEDHVFEAPA